jgi:hypothetical protein
LREISSLEAPDQDIVVKYFSKLPDIAFIDSFKYSVSLKENLFLSLTIILKNIGKKKFRGYVELFIDPIFRNLKSNYLF